jgi:hypothetical protein
MTQLNNIEAIEITSEANLTAFKASKLHVVCTANVENSFCNTFLSSVGESAPSIKRFCDTVNTKYEPGCLFPKYTLTLFPLFRADRASTAEVDLRKFIQDVFLAQVKYFKSNTMLFCFDAASWPDMNRVKSILVEEMEAHPLPNVEAVYFY